MIASHSSRRWVFLSILILLLPLLSCNTPPPEPPKSSPQANVTGQPPPAATSVPTTAVPNATPTEATVQRDVVYGSGPFDLPDPTAGLAQLSSYVSTLTMMFDGTDKGKPQKWSQTIVMRASQQPARRQLKIEKTGDSTDPSPIFTAEQDGMRYGRLGKNQCTGSALQTGNSLGERSEPALFLIGVIGADEAGGGMVNGVETKHYTFDERALGELGITQAAGELWVASTGDYLVKYLVTATAKAEYLGEGLEGKLTIDYELTDADKPVTFALPADCPPGMVNAPLLPAASNVNKVPGLLTFDTSATVASASEFYQQQLPGQGWKAQGEPMMIESTAILEYAQGDQTMTLLIRGDAAVTNVNILLSRATK